MVVLPETSMGRTAVFNVHPTLGPATGSTDIYIEVRLQTAAICPSRKPGKLITPPADQMLSRFKFVKDMSCILICILRKDNSGTFSTSIRDMINASSLNRGFPNSLVTPTGVQVGAMGLIAS